MKKVIKRLVAVALAFALSVPAFAAGGVNKTTASIGGATANVVYINMSAKNRVLLPAVANNSISTDTAAMIISRGITREDVIALPKGEKIAGILFRDK